MHTSKQNVQYCDKRYYKLKVAYSLQFILVFAFVDYQYPVIGDYTFPSWADGLGWCFVSISLIYIFTYAMYYICGETGTFIEVSRLIMIVCTSPHLNSMSVCQGDARELKKSTSFFYCYELKNFFFEFVYSYSPPLYWQMPLPLICHPGSVSKHEQPQ